jgi:hypothetical protein
MTQQKPTLLELLAQHPAAEPASPPNKPADKTGALQRLFGRKPKAEPAATTPYGALQTFKREIAAAADKAIAARTHRQDLEQALTDMIPNLWRR